MSADGIVIPEDEPRPSKKAVKEAARISEGNLRRDEAVRTHIHRAGLVILWAVVVVMLLLALIWAWHMASPDRWHFLTIEERNNIQTVLLSAMASSFATQMVRRWENPQAPSDPDATDSN